MAKWNPSWRIDPRHGSTELEERFRGVVSRRCVSQFATKNGMPIRFSDATSGVECVLVNPWPFIMGAGSGERRTSSLERLDALAGLRVVSEGHLETDDAAPECELQVWRPYYIGKTVVTQGQWGVVMDGTTPPGSQDGPNFPVNSVAFESAQLFCSRIGGRLPTEREWEYACKGWKSTPDSAQAHHDLDRVAWYIENSTREGFGPTLHEVALREPTDFGLYDMLGNVWEWCSDWYDPRHYQRCHRKESALKFTDGWAQEDYGPDEGTSRVVRGGAYDTDVNTCRASFRGHLTEPVATVGFRVVIDIDSRVLLQMMSSVSPAGERADDAR